MSQDTKTGKDIEVIYTKFLRLYEHIAGDRIAINKQIVSDRADTNKQINDDRLAMAKQMELLAKVITELRAEAEIAADFKHQVQKDIVEVMQEVTDILGEKIEKELKDAVTTGINHSVKEIYSSISDLKKAVNEGESLLKKYQKYELDNGLVRFVTICITGIICVLIVCNFIIGEPYVRFNSDQAYKYSLGSKMDFIWGKLTKEEKNRFDVLYKEQEEEYRRELENS